MSSYDLDREGGSGGEETGRPSRFPPSEEAESYRYRPLESSSSSQQHRQATSHGEPEASSSTTYEYDRQRPNTSVEQQEPRQDSSVPDGDRPNDMPASYYEEHSHSNSYRQHPVVPPQRRQYPQSTRPMDQYSGLSPAPPQGRVRGPHANAYQSCPAHPAGPSGGQRQFFYQQYRQQGPPPPPLPHHQQLHQRYSPTIDYPPEVHPTGHRGEDRRHPSPAFDNLSEGSEPETRGPPSSSQGHSGYTSQPPRMPFEHQGPMPGGHYRPFPRPYPPRAHPGGRQSLEYYSYPRPPHQDNPTAGRSLSPNYFASGGGNNFPPPMSRRSPSPGLIIQHGFRHVPPNARGGQHVVIPPLRGGASRYFNDHPNQLHPPYMHPPQAEGDPTRNTDVQGHGIPKTKQAGAGKPNRVVDAATASILLSLGTNASKEDNADADAIDHGHVATRFSHHDGANAEGDEHHDLPACVSGDTHDEDTRREQSEQSSLKQQTQQVSSLAQSVSCDTEEQSSPSRKDDLNQQVSTDSAETTTETATKEEVPLIVPEVYPTRLALPHDSKKLNALHCFVRSELLEVFVVQPKLGAKKSPAHAPGSSLGRVGLRCVHCAIHRQRTGGDTSDEAPMAVFYPKNIAEIYRLVTSWQRCHVRKCKRLPPAVRKRWQELRDTEKSRGKTNYWVHAAIEIGLVDLNTPGGGVRFGPKVLEYRPSSSPMNENAEEESSNSSNVDGARFSEMVPQV
jgi:hypothetical protein